MQGEFFFYFWVLQLVFQLQIIWWLHHLNQTSNRVWSFCWVWVLKVWSRCLANLWQVLLDRLFFPQQILRVSFHKIWLQQWSHLLPCPYGRLCHLFVVSVKPFVKLGCKQDHWDEQVGWELLTALLSKLTSCEATPFGCVFMIQHVWLLYQLKLFLHCVLKLLLYEDFSGTFHLGRWSPTWPSLTCILPVQKSLGLHTELEQDCSELKAALVGSGSVWCTCGRLGSFPEGSCSTKVKGQVGHWANDVKLWPWFGISSDWWGFPDRHKGLQVVREIPALTRRLGVVCAGSLL